MNGKTGIYEVLTKFFGKKITKFFHNILITRFKIKENKKSLLELKVELNKYKYSSFRGNTEYELVNQSFFSLTFSIIERLNILSYQYNFFSQHLTLEIQDKLFNSGVSLWNKYLEEQKHEIFLKLTQKFEYEGCLSLVYYWNGVEIYILSFTICKGSCFNLNDPLIILISRIQGTKGNYNQIAKASKQLNDIFPASSLMASLEGFCLNLGINKIIGIGAKNQVSIKFKELEQTKIHYDDFWKTFDAIFLEASGDFLITVPYPLKSLKLIKSKFRKRTIAKRNIRKDISTNSQENLRNIFKL